MSAPRDVPRYGLDNYGQRLIEMETGAWVTYLYHLEAIEALAAKLVEVEQQSEARKTALEFAAAALGDAIYLEDGLDGETGTRVKRIVVEAIEHGTFDAPSELGDFLTARERKTADGIKQLQAERDGFHESWEAAERRVKELEGKLQEREKCAAFVLRDCPTHGDLPALRQATAQIERLREQLDEAEELLKLHRSTCIMDAEKK